MASIRHRNRENEEVAKSHMRHEIAKEAASTARRRQMRKRRNGAKISEHRNVWQSAHNDRRAYHM